MKDVKLELSVVEINTILKALGQFPYNQVNEVITKIHFQASTQITAANGQNENPAYSEVSPAKEKAAKPLNN